MPRISTDGYGTISFGLLKDYGIDIHRLAREINEAIDATPEAVEMDKAKGASDFSVAEVGEGLKTESEIVHAIMRNDSGLIERMKKYLDFDILSCLEYDGSDCLEKSRHAHEICRILYIFYMLENHHFKSISKELRIIRKGVRQKEYRKQFNALKFLSKPTIESIDYSKLNRTTFNGKITKHIKDSIEKELSNPTRERISLVLQTISGLWDEFLRELIFRIDVFGLPGQRYEKLMDFYLLKPMSEKPKDPSETGKHSHSPIEYIYLKVLQFEYLCTVEDISKTDRNKTNRQYDVSPEFVGEFMSLSEEPIRDIDEYIIKNAQKLATLVWYNKTVDSGDYRTIRSYAEKVKNWLEFCIWQRIPDNIDDLITEKLIVSCLQSFIIDKNEDFNDYDFHLSQNYMDHLPTDRAVLSQKVGVPAVKQINWVHKVLDRMYANEGRYGTQKKIREYVNHCYESIKIIFKCSSVDEMLKMHEHYFHHCKALADELILLSIQAKNLNIFLLNLHDKGFRFIDEKKAIFQVFTAVTQVEYLREFFVVYTNMAVFAKKIVLHIQIKNTEKASLPFEVEIVHDSHDLTLQKDSESEGVFLDIIFSFDYEYKVCTVTDFKLRQ